MTHIIIAGSEKPIEFTKVLTAQLITEKFDIGHGVPANWNYIELICKNYTPGFDLMFAYDDANKRGDGSLFVGHFNAGGV